MNIFRSISEGYKRARHTCGYGVHSPFAYRMVCRMRLSRGWGWYAERQLADCVHSSCRKGTCDATGRLADTLRFYRLCVDAGGDIFVDRDAPAPIRLAARLAAGGRYKVMTDVQRLDSCVAAWTQTKVISGAMAEAMARGSLQRAMLHGFSDDEVKELFTVAGATLLLQGPRNSLLFRRDGMHPVVYTVNY